jgi:hypothetical protein
MALFLTACATASNQTENPPERVLATMETGTVRSHDPMATDSTISASPDSAFAALQSAYQDLGIEIKIIDPAGREIGNRRFTKMYDIAGVKMSKYVGCGSSETGPTADSYRITMSIISRVIPAPEGSRIDTQLTATAQDPGTSKGALSCISLGGLEQRIHGLTAKHLGG